MNRPCHNLRCGRHSVDRRGFTLLELLLVLMLLVVIGAAAWPSLQHGYDNYRLRRAADQVVTAFGHARVQAMSKGLTEVFRFEPNTPKYTIEAMPDDTVPADADSSNGSAGSTPSSTGSAGTQQNQSPGSTCGELPEGFAFKDVQRTLDNRTAAAESELSANGPSSASAPPVLFFPDGTSSEATLTLADKNGLSISVSIRGLTSFARVGDIFRGEAHAP